MTKKQNNFAPTFGLFNPNLTTPLPPHLVPRFFLEAGGLTLLAVRQLDIVPSDHPMQFPGKLMNQTSENGKKPNSRPDFELFGPNMDLQIFISGFYLS